MTVSTSTLRVAVLVSRPEYDAFKAYSEATGIRTTRLIRDAMRAYPVKLNKVQK
jgi:hypothetical protein